MNELPASLDANRDAVRDLMLAVDRVAALWTTPPAPGKWSPSQIVEHVARSLEESAEVVAQHPSKFPRLPVLVRPLVKMLLFNRVLRNGTFPKARTNKAMDPLNGPPTPEDGRIRVEAALAAFDRACRAVPRTTIDTPTFGTVPLADYARFIAVHTRHHQRQIPDGHDLARARGRS